jgi:hypothetical protein
MMRHSMNVGIRRGGFIYTYDKKCRQVFESRRANRIDATARKGPSLST